MAKGFGLAVAATYLVYLVFSWNQPSDIFPFSGDSTFQTLLRRTLWPPTLYWRGLSTVASKLSRPAFILGHLYETGQWFYFPLMFALKNTLPFLALCGFAFLVPLAARRERDAITPDAYAPHRRACWLFLAAFGASAILSEINIGYRHFSVPAALILLLFALLPSHVAGSSAARLAVAGLAAASIGVSIWAFPNYLPYFNALASARSNFWWTNDSNIDWNQSLPAVQQFVESQHLSEILVQETAANDILPYIPKARLWNCQAEEPADADKWAVVSASEITFGHNCTWLLDYPRQPIGGGSMYLFRLPSPAPAAGSSGGPPLRLEWWTMRVPTPGDLRPQIVGLLDREVPPDAIPR